MNTKNTFIIIFIIVLSISSAVIAIIVLGSNNTNNTNLQNNASVAQNTELNTQTNSESSSKGVTLEEVQRNNTLSSCMVIYNDNVYKIPSSFASQHQGGAREITSACGKDITSNFNSVGDHDSTAENMLAGFFFAKLEK